MNKLYFKLFYKSLIVALVLSALSFFTLVKIAEESSEGFRSEHMLFLAQTIETENAGMKLEDVRLDHRPPRNRDRNRLRGRRDFRTPPRRGPIPRRSSLWLVSDEGRIFSANNRRHPVIAWNEIKLPKEAHVLKTVTPFFSFSPRIYVMKLETSPVSFLISQELVSPFAGRLIWIQGGVTFATVALALFLALSLTVYYLRRKSLEARDILSKLERGNLKARFPIQRFDEFGNLMLDFNRMASEIERLVNNLNTTEASRSHLLQELGHDLRTPLTSLNTAFETLKTHDQNLKPQDRTELYSMITSDINYFRDLLEKLTIIASIDVPQYKPSTEKINLTQLLKEEIKTRRAKENSRIHWFLDEAGNGDKFILGDTHLIVRLIKNGLDNASRFTQAEVRIGISDIKGMIRLTISDDGKGLTDEALAGFAQRRERRSHKEDGKHFSLGLGSVIMKAITSVHGGTVEIQNRVVEGKVAGANLMIELPRA